MQSHYEINVALNGKHLFATHERSCVTNLQVREVYKHLSKKFPASEGYELSVTYESIEGRNVTGNFLKG